MKRQTKIVWMILLCSVLLGGCTDKDRKEAELVRTQWSAGVLL